MIESIGRRNEKPKIAFKIAHVVRDEVACLWPGVYLERFFILRRPFAGFCMRQADSKWTKRKPLKPNSLPGTAQGLTDRYAVHPSRALF